MFGARRLREGGRPRRNHMQNDEDQMTVKPLYRRVLLKASGEALMVEQHFGIDVSVVDRIAADIA